MIAKDSGQKNNFHILPSFITSETRWNWAQLTFSKSFETVTKEREKIRPIADWHVPSNNPRNNCEMHFSSISLVVSKVTKPID